MSLACSTVRYSFRTSERTRSGSLSSGGPHPPPPPLRRLTFSPRTSLSPPTLRATIGSRPCLKTMQVFGAPSVPPSTPQVVLGAADGHREGGLRAADDV